MAEDVERFLRGAHIAARLVEEILEHGPVRAGAGAPLTFPQFNLLKFIARPGNVRSRDVARFLNASGAAASKAVARLERRRLVRFLPDPLDRRSARIMLTRAGEAAIRRVERIKRERVKLLLRGGSPGKLAEGLEELIRVLMRGRALAGNPCLGCGAYYARECVVREHGQPCSCPS